MQSYETLLETVQPAAKSLKDAVSAAAKHQKALAKDMETGDLTDAGKRLGMLADATEQLAALVAELRDTLGGFDTSAYFSEGDFTRQLLDACARRGIDVQGEKGLYEMFPYKLRIIGDGEHTGEVWLDRKKLASVRPDFVAETVRLGQAKLYASTFKESIFMNELADAYETSCLKSGVRIGSTQALNKIYKCLAPTARARREYDTQAYAFDLARLYEAGPSAWVTKAGTRYDFGTSRDGKSAIRVLSRAGTESFISTLRPLSGDEA